MVRSPIPVAARRDDGDTGIKTERLRRAVLFCFVLNRTLR
jgi:hypothetical protein